jgi:hypothetical protein
MTASADAKAASASPPNADAGGVLSRLSELAWKALPAIGSAIGFVGFVAIVGGAIEWIRFDAAGLPATQAVLAVPNHELVVVGALALGVFVPAAIGAVLVVYLIDSDGNATPRTARGLIAVGIAEMAVSLFFIGHHDPLKYVWLGLWLILILFVAGYLVGLVMRDFRRRTKVKRARARVLAAQATLAAAADARDAAATAVKIDDGVKAKEALAQTSGTLGKARKEFKRAIAEWRSAADRVVGLQQRATGKDTVEEIDKKQEEVGRLGTPAPGLVQVEVALEEVEDRLGHAFRATLGQIVESVMHTPEGTDGNQPEAGPGRIAGAVAIALIGAAAIVTGFVLLVDEVPWVAVLFLAIGLLTAMNVFVARATDKFALYGIAVFFSVLMFGAALTIARTLHEPKVQPIALVRKGNEVGTCGVYIAQTGERVYVGRLALGENDKHKVPERASLIFWVPTSDVEVVSVGQSERIGPSFPKLAEAMLTRLYADRAEEAAAALQSTTVTSVKSGPSAGDSTTTATQAPPAKTRPRKHPRVAMPAASCTAEQHIDP